MKINAISNLKGTYYTNYLQDKNTVNSNSSYMTNNMPSNSVNNLLTANAVYNDAMVKNKNIPFTASVASAAKELAKQIPLEDRIASIFQVFQHGDVIFVSKSLKEGQNALKSSYKTVNQLFKKAFFIEDNNVPGTLAFIKHKQGDIELWNVNKSNIIINGKDSLAPKESCYIVEGDKYKIGDFELPVKSNPKANLSMLRHSFSTVFDFEKDVTPMIEKQNLKSILSLVKNERVTMKPLMFSDIGGQDKAIDIIKKGVLFPIRYPEAYKNMPLNHGVILYGPPGTGKTRLAQALSNEADINFIKLNGLEMESKWVGESEENWRSLFQTAKESQPSILFIDEFDAVAKERGGADVYGDKVVNQLLTLMSDLEKDGDDVFVITATNKLDTLDKAITRSGRFGLHVPMELPDEKGARQILDIHTKDLPIDIDKDELAKTLVEKKASGADIAAIVTNARSQAFERFGIYQKMDDGTFNPDDLANLKINKDDFDKAISELFQKTQKRPIGYNHYNK